MMEILKKLETLISEVIRMQKGPVAKACPECEAPCCARVQYLFDEKDVLFLRLSGREGDHRKKYGRGKGCPFLSSRGCLLVPQARPFTCHRYICPRLEQTMDRQNAELRKMLNAKFREIEGLRSDLWSAYLDRQHASL
jgi:hypothetical protein